jgi:hypothetical protein
MEKIDHLIFICAEGTWMKVYYIRRAVVTWMEDLDYKEEEERIG